jgi:hypothetical protein
MTTRCVASAVMAFIYKFGAAETIPVVLRTHLRSIRLTCSLPNRNWFNRTRVLTVLVCLFLKTGYADVSISDDSHPAHYVFLIDASGSTISSRSKRRDYCQTLQQISQRAFDGRLAPGLPPIAAQTDRVSVLDFGIVDVHQPRPLRSLRIQNFLNSLIHVRQLAASPVDQSVLFDWLFPDETYAFTMSQFAVPLGISALPGTLPEFNRTYVIIATDGLANGGSFFQRETSFLRRFADPAQVDALLAQQREIESGYRIIPLDAGAPRGILRYRSSFTVATFAVEPISWESTLNALRKTGFITDVRLSVKRSGALLPELRYDVRAKLFPGIVIRHASLDVGTSVLTHDALSARDAFVLSLSAKQLDKVISPLSSPSLTLRTTVEYTDPHLD